MLHRQQIIIHNGVHLTVAVKSQDNILRAKLTKYPFLLINNEQYYFTTDREHDYNLTAFFNKSFSQNFKILVPLKLHGLEIFRN
jgi:hypothetical protein